MGLVYPFWSLGPYFGDIVSVLGRPYGYRVRASRAYSSGQGCVALDGVLGVVGRAYSADHGTASVGLHRAFCELGRSAGVFSTCGLATDGERMVKVIYAY